ncbi:MAG: hypothetical protein O7F08_01325 [Deltaproteobacteria bacterium]|nr:hypothetical protein [Deltaproteobacteria bacterium]
MTRILVVVILLVGCRRSNEPPVVIAPGPAAMLPNVPSDPFGTPGPAYDRLRQVTDAARTTSWNGQVDELAAWLEGETLAVEQSLALMKTIRLGASDVYGVANGRIALLYEHIASTLMEAEVVVKEHNLDFDWIGQEALLWERANAFWARCTRGCSLGGPYLDGWELRCQAGVEETAAKSAP